MKILISQSRMFSKFAEMCHNAGHEVITVKNVLDSADLTKAFRASSSIIRSMRVPDTSNLPKESMRFVSNDLFGYLYTRIPDMVRIISGLEGIEPDVIVVHNDIEPINRMMCEWANLKGIPSVHVPHSIHIQNINRGKVGTDIHDIVTASHLASSGTKQTKWYTRRGMSPTNTIEVGYLPFDTQDYDDFPREFLGIDNDMPVIVYASSWGQVTNMLGGNSEWKDAYITFLESVDHENNNVIIKTHPNGNNNDWHIEEAKKRGVRCLVTSNYKDNVLMAADTIVAFGGSNILIDASLINNKATLISIGGDFGSKTVTHVSMDRITHELPMVLSNGVFLNNNIDLFNKFVSHGDGKASERLLRFVEEIA